MEKVVFHKQNYTLFLALLWTLEEMMEQPGMAPVSEVNRPSLVRFYETICCPATKEVSGITG